MRGRKAKVLLWSLREATAPSAPRRRNLIFFPPPPSPPAVRRSPPSRRSASSTAGTVLTAAQRHEPRLRRQEERRAALERHLALGPVGLADQEVLVAAEPERVAVVDPERLDRLELAPDVGLKADEDQAAVGAVVLVGPPPSGSP